MNFNFQEAFFNLLKKEINNNKLSHAYLIETNNMTELDQFIVKLAKILLCPNSLFDEKCDKCNICNLIEKNIYPDLKIIDTDSMYIKKEQLLKVKEEFNSKSVYNGRQVYIIKDASKLNSSSGNTILKFLEEPEENIIAILLVKNRYTVLETILSRCQVFSLDEEEKLEFDDNVFKLIETLFIKNRGFLFYKEIMCIMPTKIEAMKYFNDIEKALFAYVNFDSEIFRDRKIDIEQLNNKKIYKLIFIIEDYLHRMEFNINYKLLLDNFIVDVLEVSS